MRGMLRLTMFALLAHAPASSLHSAQAVDPIPEVPREFSPQVQALFAAGGHAAQMARNYLRYANALRAGGAALDIMVAPDVRLHDQEASGFIGLEGLKRFRAGQNTDTTYERVVVRSIKVPAPDMTEAEVCTERTLAATGAKYTIVIHARNRWANGKVVERWDRSERLPEGVGCG
jgi:hypothetical protein